MTKEQELIIVLANTDKTYSPEDEHEVQETLEKLKELLMLKKCCDNCKFFEKKEGNQSDGLRWSLEECLNGNWTQPMEIDLNKITCSEWEKNDE